MGLGIRFVIGHSTDRAAEAAVAVEQQQHGDMMRLDLQVMMSPPALPARAPLAAGQHGNNWAWPTAPRLAGCGGRCAPVGGLPAAGQQDSRLLPGSGGGLP